MSPEVDQVPQAIPCVLIHFPQWFCSFGFSVENNNVESDIIRIENRKGFWGWTGGSVEALLVGGAVEVELGGMLEGVELSEFLLVT